MALIEGSTSRSTKLLRIISIFLSENGSTLRRTQYIIQVHIMYCFLYVPKLVLILLYKSLINECVILY